MVTVFSHKQSLEGCSWLGISGLLGREGGNGRGPGADLLGAQSSLFRTSLVTVLVAAMAINGHENASECFLNAYVTTSSLQSQKTGCLAEFLEHREGRSQVSLPRPSASIAENEGLLIQNNEGQILAIPGYR